MKDTKEKILAAASQLFLSGGINALSVRAISKEANLSTIGIYSYFNGKQGILDALYIEGFNMVLAATDVNIDKNDPKSSAMNAAKGYLQTALNHQAHYRLIFGASDASYQPSEEARNVSEKAFIRITKIVGALLPEQASIEQRQQAALQVWSLVHGYLSLKQHAISEVFEGERWEGMILDAVSLHLDALMGKFK